MCSVPYGVVCASFLCCVICVVTCDVSVVASLDFLHCVVSVVLVVETVVVGGAVCVVDSAEVCSLYWVVVRGLIRLPWVWVPLMFRPCRWRLRCGLVCVLRRLIV